MADQRITQLTELTEAAVAANDVLPISDISASQTKKVTVKSLIEAGYTLSDAGSIDLGKLDQSSTTKLGASALAANAVTAAKLANDSSIAVDTTAPTTDNFEGRGYYNSSTGVLQIYSAGAYANISASTGTGAVDTAQLANGAVTTAKINAAGLATAAIADDAITTAKVADDAITADQLATDSVTADAIAAGAVGSSELASDAVTYDKLQNTSSTDVVLGRSSAGGGNVEEITCTSAGRSVIGAADAAAQRTALGLGTLATQSGTFSGTHSGTSSGTNTGDQTIQLTGDVTGIGTGAFAATIVNDAVTTAKINGNAVTTAKIADDAVTSAKLADNSTAQTGTGAPTGSGAFTAQEYIDTASGITYYWDGAAWQNKAVSIPAATTSVTGTVKVGSGLQMNESGQLGHLNSVATGTFTKVTVDAQGHVTTGTTLVEGDIPNLGASKITTGTLNPDLFGTNSITGPKLANSSTVQFGGAGSTSGIVTFPTADFKGQYFYDELNQDLYIWSGSAWLPITIISGELVLAGTYDASVNQVGSVTSAGAAAGLTVGAALPAASDTNNRYYLVVSDSGTGSGNAPAEALAPPDMILSNGTSWELIDVSNAIAGQTATNISFTPYGNISAANVQAALQELDDEKLAVSGGTITGTLEIGTTGSLRWEGSTADAYETTLTVVDPTSDHTITLPNISGTVITTGDTGTVTSTMIADGTIVDADVSASAEIAVSKLADGAARQLLQTDAAGTGVEWTSNVDVPGTLDVTSTATFDSIASHPLGSAAAPTITFTGDTNTGIYSPGADQVAISTNGTGRLFVDSSGSVGIGVSSPSHALDVLSVPSGTVAARFRGNASATNNTQIRFYGANAATDQWAIGNAIDSNDASRNFDIYDIVAVANRLRIDSSGRVGIGTSSPGSLLTLGTNAPRLEFNDGDSATDNKRWQFVTGATNFTIRCLTDAGAAGGSTFSFTRSNENINSFQASAGGTAWFHVDNSTQRVGIGTTSPGGTLDVKAAASTAPLIVQGPSSEFARIDSSGRLLVGTSTGNSLITADQTVSRAALSTTAPARIYTGTGTITDNTTAASGTVTHGTIVAFDNPAIAASNLTVTYTNASTVYIDGAPTAGTNVTVTNPYALYVNAGTSFFGGNVNLSTGNEYRINNTKVVGARVTGWTAATGTATRTAFATSTVTTAQLAERVKALIDDLISHGLIGT